MACCIQPVPIFNTENSISPFIKFQTIFTLFFFLSLSCRLKPSFATHLSFCWLLSTRFCSVWIRSQCQHPLQTWQFHNLSPVASIEEGVSDDSGHTRFPSLDWGAPAPLFVLKEAYSMSLFPISGVYPYSFIPTFLLIRPTTHMDFTLASSVSSYSY